MSKTKNPAAPDAATEVTQPAAVSSQPASPVILTAPTRAALTDAVQKFCDDHQGLRLAFGAIAKRNDGQFTIRIDIPNP